MLRMSGNQEYGREAPFDKKLQAPELSDKQRKYEAYMRAAKKDEEKKIVDSRKPYVRQGVSEDYENEGLRIGLERSGSAAQVAKRSAQENYKMMLEADKYLKPVDSNPPRSVRSNIPYDNNEDRLYGGLNIGDSDEVALQKKREYTMQMMRMREEDMLNSAYASRGGDDQQQSQSRRSTGANTPSPVYGYDPSTDLSGMQIGQRADMSSRAKEFRQMEYKRQLDLQKLQQADAARLQSEAAESQYGIPKSAPRRAAPKDDYNPNEYPLTGMGAIGSEYGRADSKMNRQADYRQQLDMQRMQSQRIQQQQQLGSPRSAEDYYNNNDNDNDNTNPGMQQRIGYSMTKSHEVLAKLARQDDYRRSLEDQQEISRRASGTTTPRNYDPSTDLSGMQVGQRADMSSRAKEFRQMEYKRQLDLQKLQQADAARLQSEAAESQYGIPKSAPRRAAPKDDYNPNEYPLTGMGAIGSEYGRADSKMERQADYRQQLDLQRMQAQRLAQNGQQQGSLEPRRGVRDAEEYYNNNSGEHDNYDGSGGGMAQIGYSPSKSYETSQKLARQEDYRLSLEAQQRLSKVMAAADAAKYGRY